MPMFVQRQKGDRMKDGEKGQTKNKNKKFGKVLGRIVLFAGTVVAFYKLPTLIADRISDRKHHNQNFEQNMEDDENEY